MNAYGFGPFVLDVERRLLTRDGAPLQLGPKVVETLLALVERPGQTLTKDELLERIWPHGFVQEGTLAQHVCVARKVLRRYWCDAIQTVPRIGYRFTGEVTALEGLDPARPWFDKLTMTQETPAAIASHPEERATKDREERRDERLRRYAALAAAVIVAIVVSFATLSEKAKSHARPHELSANGARYFSLGKYYWNQRTKDGMHKGARYFTMVVVSDPNDARGYAGLAETYALEGMYGYGPMPYAQSYKMAEVYARRAIAIDPRSAEAHAALGLAEEERSSKLALAEYRRALKLDPTNSSAVQWYGGILLNNGQVGAALRTLRRASQLDPSSVATLSWLSSAAYFARRYDEAIRSAHEALDLSPTRADAYMGMGLAYEMRGNYRQAELAYRAYARQCALCGSDAAALLAHLYASERKIDDAKAELAIATHATPMKAHEETSYDMIAALLALGMRPQALALVAKARHESPLIGADPRLDPVRNDPRFRPYLSSSLV